MRKLIPIILVTLLVFVVFGVLQFLKISMGNYIDWIIAMASFWWLIVITKFPWDMHFKAKEVLDDVRESAEKNIKLNPVEVTYAKKVAQRYLFIAIGLHIFSAAGLFFLSFAEVSKIGYIGSVVALLLTLLRPAIRIHDYVVRRLSIITQQIKYPRDDIYKLLNDLQNIDNRLRFIEAKLDLNQPSSMISEHKSRLDLLQNKLNELFVNLDQVKLQNLSEHEKLSKKGEEAIAQLSEDSRFLNQVRELIRFFKQA